MYYILSLYLFCKKIILFNLIILSNSYNIYFIYYIYNGILKFLYDMSFKFILKYTFLNSFNHNVPLFYHYFSLYMQNYYIRINFANFTLELIKFSKTGRKMMMKSQTVGFLATIKLSSNDRFPSTSTNTIIKISKASPTNWIPISVYQIERAVSKYVNCSIRLAHIGFVLSSIRRRRW